MSTDSSGRYQGDLPEMLAAEKIRQALDGLNAAERRRILRWAVDRFVTPGQRAGFATETTCDAATDAGEDPRP